MPRKRKIYSNLFITYFTSQLVLLVQQETILDKIETVLMRRTSTITEEQKKAIDNGLQSLENGEKVSHNNVMEQMKEKYPKYFK